MFVAEAVTVATSAGLLIDPERNEAGTATAPQMWIVYNNDASNSIFVGDSTVTTSSGVPVKPGEYLTIPLWGKEQVYAIAENASVNVRLGRTNGASTDVVVDL